MRYAQEVKVRPGAQKSGSTSVPAPIGGLNARDSVANMAQQDAIELENLFPDTTSVNVRKGYSAWSTFTGLCQSILVYAGMTSTKVFPCVKNGSTYSIYDGTSSGALSTAAVGGAGATVQALTNTRFDHLNFGTTGGNFLTVVNGSDTPLQFDGTTWTVSTMTGLTTANLFTVTNYSSRLWFAQKNTQDVWYLPTGSITGALTKFNLGPVFKLGGYINSIISVSDSSNTLNDYIVFLSSEGEMVAYQGDPASTFTRVAQFRIGRPVTKGQRSWIKWGTDAIVLCTDGAYPIRKAISDNSRDSGLSVSDKIRNLINADVLVYGGKLGWDIKVHASGAKLIINVPTAEDSAAYQYVMNVQTGAWCKYTGWNALCFSVALDTLWMGMSGKMVKADDGTDDDGADITTYCRQAFNYFGMRGRAKHAKLLRPILASDGEFYFGIGMDVDYKDTGISSTRLVTGGGGDPWGGVWDVAWSGAYTANTRWYGITGLGHALSIKMTTTTNGVGVIWSATDVVYEGGGILT